jgi:hypothetical protein
MTSALNWFEIPAADIERAKKFYSEILGVELIAMEVTAGYPMAMFPAKEGGIGGALISGEGYAPSQKGSLIYLNGGSDLDNVIGKVEAAGGKVEMPKKPIGEHGFVGIFHDTEGNRVGLHSPG